MIHVHTSRRTFLLGVAGLSGRPRRIFDSHLHCPGENGARRQGARAVSTFQEFVACLDRSGIQRGIVSSVRSLFARSPADFIAGNREVVRRVESYGDRFIGACVVNPMFIDEALREMEDCRNQFGCLWVSENAGGEGTTRYGAREFELLVKQTAKLSMALAVHTDVDGMEQVAGKFPAAAIVFAHAGERRSPMDPSRAIGIAARLSNCRLDTSGAWPGRGSALEQAVRKIGEDRILFGSDFLFHSPEVALAPIEQSALSERQKRKILSGNLEAMLAGLRKGA